MRAFWVSLLLGLCWASATLAGPLTLLGAGKASSGPPPVAVYWSTTDIHNFGDFNFSNPDAVTPLTVERVLNSGASYIGRANVGVAQGQGNKTFYVTVNVRNGFQCIGVSNATQALNLQLGGSPNSIGYCTTGEVNRNGSDQGGLATWTGGDVIGVRVNTTNDTVEFSKNSTTVWSATYSITSLGNVDIFPAQFTQSLTGKYTADFSGLP